MSTNTACTGKVYVFSWGANNYGELGHGHKDDLLKPTFLSEEECDFTVSAGGGHVFFYTPFNCYADSSQGSQNEIKGCGWNAKGQLGLDTSDQTVQTITDIPQLRTVKIKKLACGWDFTLCLDTDGTISAFGSNAYGQLGNGDVGKKFSHDVTPILLHGKVTDVTAGLRHAAAITDNGQLFTWGAGKKGQLGLPLEKFKANVTTPTEVHLTCKPVKVLAGAYHTVVLSEDGEVFVMGDNKHAQMTLDPNSVRSLSEPYKLHSSLFKQERVVDIWTGWTHILAKTESGIVYSWGRNDYGQLGRASVCGWDRIPCPVPEVKDCVNCACGSEHNLALLADGSVLSWGWNEHGICGTGDEKHVLVPQRIVAPFAKKAIKVFCGMGQSFVISNP